MSLATTKKPSLDNTHKKKHDIVYSALKKTHTTHNSPLTPLIQRKPTCPCDGGCPRCQPSYPVQAKLTIGQPSDKYEQELIQTKPLVQRQVEPEDEVIQAESGGEKAPRLNSSLASQIQSLNGGGRLLSESDRTSFEKCFGRDFKNVRIHTDVQANTVAEQLSARAFTFGRNIVFGAGQYKPDTEEGKCLLAHELTHVVQQSQTPNSVPSRLAHHSEPSELEADMVAKGWSNGRYLSVEPRSESIGVIARVPLEILRHNWEEVAILAQQAQQQFSRQVVEEGESRRRHVPEPPDMTHIQSVERAQAIIRRDRGDVNFPSRARNAANQVLRSFGIIRYMLRVRALGGVEGTMVRGSLQELQVQANVDRITNDVGTPIEWYSDWVFNVQSEIDSGATSFLNSFPLRLESVVLRGRALERFQRAYDRAEELRSIAVSAEIRARIFALMRNLERVMYLVRSSGGGASTESDAELHERTWFYWLSVYHRLGGTGRFIAP